LDDAAKGGNVMTRRRSAAAAMEALRESYPPLFGRHARRPRLTGLLDESKAQTILLTAPAGYGKTTLAAEWVQGRDDVVWYRATSGSADVAAFPAGLADIMEPFVPHVGNRLKQRLRVAETPEKAARPLAEILSEDLGPWPADALLIIDDYHLVTDSEPVEEFMDWLLMLTPALRVLVTTRSRPKWASARRILYGEVTEIDRGQLAMTTDEAALVLEGSSTEDVQALVEQAEGWPALIGLAALSATHEIPKERVSETLYRYFAEEVVRGEPPEVERFMLMASVPSQIDPGGAPDLIGLTDVEPVLQRLVNEGLLQADRKLFRFHPLLRAFLQRVFKGSDPIAFADLARKHIEAARDKEDWEEAFSLAIEAEQFELALEVLEPATPSFLASGQVEVLERWLKECGDHATRDPWAGIVRTELLIRQGDLARALAVARSLPSHFASDDGRASRAWYLVGFTSHLLSEETDALEAHRRAYQSARSPQEQCAALWGAFMAAWELGLPDTSSYLDALEAVASDPATRIRVATGRLIDAASKGSLRGTEEIYEPLIPIAEHANDPMAETSFLSRVAEAHVTRGNFSEAQALANRVLAIAETLQLGFVVPHCLLPRATAEIGLRQFSAARQTIRRLAQSILKRDDPYLEVAGQVLQLKLKISNPRHQFREGEISRYAWERAHNAIRAEYLSLRALKASGAGDANRAFDLQAQAVELSHGIDTIFVARFAGLIADLSVSGTSDDLEVATMDLVQACADAEAFEALILAARACPRWISLTMNDPPTESVVKRTLVRSGDTELVRNAGLASSEFDSAEASLTAREREVLSCLADGLSNSAIASRLFISQSTVKVHVHHILKKLHVESRLQAVLKAAKDEPAESS
jgi:LuxR family maltose regulon positive regulatory protein